MRRDATGYDSSSLTGGETVRAFVLDPLLFELDESPGVPFDDVANLQLRRRV